MGALICAMPARALGLVALLACSPEARRVRDGGPGADPDNKRLVARPLADPKAADTTLWPGRDPAPVERLASGNIPPPTFPVADTAPPDSGTTPVTPNVPPSGPQQRTYDQGDRADPRRQTGTTE